MTVDSYLIGLDLVGNSPTDLENNMEMSYS